MNRSTPGPHYEAFNLIPKGLEAKFVRMNGRGFVRDTLDRLYTVYSIKIQCQERTWVIYRRYGQFLELIQKLQKLDKAQEGDLYLELFPRKKLIGSFDPIFLSKRQAALSRWLENILGEPLNKSLFQSDVVRTFLTWKADQISPSPALKRMTVNDFEMKKVLGQGSFGLVVLVIHKLVNYSFCWKDGR